MIGQPQLPPSHAPCLRPTSPTYRLYLWHPTTQSSWRLKVNGLLNQERCLQARLPLLSISHSYFPLTCEEDPRRLELPRMGRWLTPKPPWRSRSEVVNRTPSAKRSNAILMSPNQPPLPFLRQIRVMWLAIHIWARFETNKVIWWHPVVSLQHDGSSLLPLHR